jgi:hypothetical protein
MWYTSFAGPLKLNNEKSKMLFDLGQKLASKGWFLRSHGSTEMDCALLTGCESFGRPPKKLNIHHETSAKAYELADRLISPQVFISKSERDKSAFLIENILGKDLRMPSRFVLTWSAGSIQVNHGIGFKDEIVASRLLREFKIPVFDLSNQDHYDRIQNFLSHEEAS